MERFSNECRQTKNKVITLSNHNKHKLPKEPKANTCNRRQARENAREQVAIGFGFTSDWPRKWREIFYPKAKRSKAKPKQITNYFRHSIVNRSNKNN